MQEFSLSAQIPLTYRSLPGEYLSQHQHYEGLITDHISPGADPEPWTHPATAVIILSEKENKPSPPKVHQTIR